MRLTLAGKLIILLVVASGLYFVWTRFVPPETRARFPLPGQASQPPASAPPAASPGGAPPGTAEGTPPAGSEGAPAGSAAAASNEILFVTTAAKRDWVQLEVERFNAAQGGRWRIVPQAIPSREAMHDILERKVLPVLWSPGGAIWPQRLAEAWRERYSTPILDTTDPNAYRVFLRSPLLFLTTRQKAAFLQPLLGGSRPWDALRALSLGTRRVPWGRFRFSHADPLTSSSGMLTLGLILNEYNEHVAPGSDPVQVAESSAFAGYLGGLERSLVYDEAARKGTTALTNAFLEQMSRYDVITGYESAALEAAPSHADLAVIYPNPTAFSEHAISLLNGDWVTATQRQGALAFLEFLGGEAAQADGLKFSFRPTRTSSLSLDERLRTYRTQGFRTNVTSIDLPPYRALNSAAYTFSQQIARSH
jgi:Bacterial extracellular solute-binding protein